MIEAAAPVLAAGVQFGTGLMNAIFTGKENKKNRQFQKEMLEDQQAYNDSVIQRQSDYQDKINAQNFAWNDEGNKRKRLEAAGYNPFLYGSNATGSAQGASFGTGTSALPPNQSSPLSGLSESLGGAVNTFIQARQANEQIKAQQISNELNQGQLDALKATLPNGKNSWENDAVKKMFEAKSIEHQANLIAIDDWTSQMNQKWEQMQALDENGAPITDENGQPVINLNAGKNAALKDAYLRVANAAKDLDIKDQQLWNMSADELLTYAKINLTNEQKKLIKPQIEELLSRAKNNRAQAAAAGASADLSRAQTETENGLRPYRVSRESHEANKSKAGAALTWNQADAQGFENEFTRPMVDWVRTPQGYWEQREVGAAGRLVKHVSPVVR